MEEERAILGTRFTTSRTITILGEEGLTIIIGGIIIMPAIIGGSLATMHGEISRPLIIGVLLPLGVIKEEIREIGEEADTLKVEWGE